MTEQERAAESAKAAAYAAFCREQGNRHFSSGMSPSPLARLYANQWYRKASDAQRLADSLAPQAKES